MKMDIKEKIIGVANVDRLSEVYTLSGFQSKKTTCSRPLMVKLYTLKTWKTIPCLAAQTSIGQIRGCPLPSPRAYFS